jgi:C-terminal processing protease CtpA/Prc
MTKLGPRASRMSSYNRPMGRAVIAVLFLLGGLGGCTKEMGGIHARMGWSEDGLRVVDVPEDGPAAHAGLREGDRVVSIDGAPVTLLTMNEAVDRLRGPTGTRCELEVLRDGEVLTLRIPRMAYDKR